MASSHKELELELLLVEAGNKLAEPPSSTDDLFTLLDQLESFLSRVEQSPNDSMQNAVSPSIKALVAENIFKHPDNDVKVAVAVCISEITRITAPDAPYLDNQMKDIFQLIVSSFANLSNKSSRLYIKRTSILETVAKVRSCVVMLDLECDALIVEMFQHFLNEIRDYHEDTVFTSMVTIMTLVLEESEDISMELLSPILACVKRDNEEVLPIARRLAKSVLENCASKLKLYLTQAVEKSLISFEDYSPVVASICQVAPNVVGQNDTATDKRVDDESRKVEAPLDNAIQENKEIPQESFLTEQVDAANGKSLTSVVSNGIAQTGENNTLDDSNFVKKQEDDHLADKSQNVDTSTVAELDGLEGDKVVNSDSNLEESTEGKRRKSRSKSTKSSDSTNVDEKEVETLTKHKVDSKNDATSIGEPNGLGGEKVVNSDSKLEESTKRKGRKSRSKSTKPSNNNHVNEKQAETLTEHKDDCEDPSFHGAESMENKRDTGAQPSVTKATKDKSNDVAAPVPSGTVHGESHSKRVARPKKKDGLSKKTIPYVDDVCKKSSEVKSYSEAKTIKPSGIKIASAVSNKDSAPIDVDKSKEESGTESDSDAKPLKQLLRKADSISNNADGTSSKHTPSKEKEMVSSGKAKKPNKHDTPMDETPKTNSKRKHTPSKEKASDTLEYDDNLVGLKVKVWWPKDRAFYDGVIQSFDRVQKKHKVWYDDGDVEILNLKREKWEVIKDESGSDKEDAADHPSPDALSEIFQKKRAKAADQPSKKATMDSSTKRGGGASSAKSKGAATKSGRKTKEDVRVDGSKNVGKSDNVTKAKEHIRKSASRSVEVASKVGNKSKNEDTDDTPMSTKSKDEDDVTPKAFTKSKQDSSKTAKSKQETPKVSSNPKGKPLKSCSKLDANGTGKLKSGSSKAKDSESTDSDEVLETAKRKRPSSFKGQENDSKSVKKRRDEPKVTSTES